MEKFENVEIKLTKVIESKGFGFGKPTDPNIAIKQVFVHITAITGMETMPKEGSRLICEKVEYTDRGFKAFGCEVV